MEEWFTVHDTKYRFTTDSTMETNNTPSVKALCLYESHQLLQDGSVDGSEAVSLCAKTCMLRSDPLLPILTANPNWRTFT